MKKYIRKIVIGMLIASSLLSAPKAYSLDDIVETKIEQSKEKKKEKKREYKVNAGAIVNEIVRGGSFGIRINKDRFINEEIGWGDYFTLSYDYAALSSGYDNLLEKERRGKEKKLLTAGYHVSYKKKPFVDVTYSSDGSIGISSTFLVGGIGKEFSNGLRLEGGFGMKTGNVDFKKENFDIINALIGYKTKKESDCKLDALVKLYSPRKYLKNNNGLYIIDGSAVLTINKRILGVMPSIGFNFRRDYIPVIENRGLDYAGIIRYNLTLGFNIERGGEIIQ